jgi:predicted CXXCH cytochrome family protein
VLFSQYPFTWEGGARHDEQPGGSTTNSGEARDFLLSKCSAQLSCVACHDPHAEDQRERLQALAGPPGNALCASCHDQLASPSQVAAHTHHRADGAGSACIGCHMPRKNMGLSYSLTRYHRIGSPTDPERVLGDRPLECALCHSDRSVEQLVTNMERWWNQRYDRTRLRALYGDDLSVNVITSTLLRGKPHEQAVAIGVLGDARATQSLPLLADQLTHPYPLVRYFAKHAIETIAAEPLAIDVGQPATEVAGRVRQWLAQYNAQQRNTTQRLVPPAQDPVVQR